MCVKIYALKPFEADIGSVSPVESPVGVADGRGHLPPTYDVIVASGHVDTTRGAGASAPMYPQLLNNGANA